MAFLKLRVDGARKTSASLRKAARKFPAAFAEGLNVTLAEIEKKELIEMERKLDRPTPFTKKAFGKFRAKPTKLNAVLYIKPIQASYLKYTIEGGILPSNITPTRAARLNKYGNLPSKRRGLEGIAGKAKKKFIAEINGTLGVWQRYGRGGSKVKLLAFVKRNAVRRKRWDFFGVAQRIVDRRLRSNVAAAIDDELREFQ